MGLTEGFFYEKKKKKDLKIARDVNILQHTLQDLLSLFIPPLCVCLAFSK